MRKQAAAEKASHKSSRTDTGVNARGLRPADTLPVILVLLYALTEFVPPMGSGEVMGSQWVWLGAVNIVTFLYLFMTGKQSVNQAVHVPLRAPGMTAFFLFIVAATASLAWAFNLSEGLVALSRHVTTLLASVALCLLLQGRLPLIRWLAGVMAIFLFVQALDVIIRFNEGVGQENLNTLIYNLKGNAGNKNILAVSLLLKIPFCLYALTRLGGWKRIALLVATGTGMMALFILNARSTFLGLGLLLFLFTATLLWTGWKTRRRQTLSTIGLLAIPLVLSLAVTTLQIRQALESQEETSPYGTVLQRLNAIRLTAEGTNSRSLIWNSAVELIREKPLTGYGIGNFKLASIPHEKEFADEFLVALHAHNDFLELSAETGLIGGLLFLLALVLTGWPLLIRILKKQPPDDPFLPALFIQLLAVYLVDSFLNFPHERPVTQFFLALILAGGFVISPPRSAGFLNRFRRTGLAAAVLISVAVVIIHVRVYRSFVAQTIFNYELKTGNLQSTPEQAASELPGWPEYNGYCYPVRTIRGIYLTEYKKYDDAIRQLHISRQTHSPLPLEAFYLGRIYLEKNQLDSARHYAGEAFSARPRSRSAYQLLNDIAFRQQDTLLLHKAFEHYTQYRPEAWAWDQYLNLRMQLPAEPSRLLELAETALKKFPGDPGLVSKRDYLSSLLKK